MKEFESKDDAYDTGYKDGVAAFSNELEDIDEHDDPEEVVSDLLDKMQEDSEGPFSTSFDADDAELDVYSVGFERGFCDAFEKHFETDESESKT